MIGYKPIFFIKWCWKYFTPGICAVSWIWCTKSRDIYSLWVINAKLLVIWLSFQGIFLFFLIKYKPLKYNNVYTYPDWGYGIGWMMAMSSMVCIPLGIVFQIWKTEGTFREVKAFFSILAFWTWSLCVSTPPILLSDRFLLSFYLAQTDNGGWN